VLRLPQDSPEQQALPGRQEQEPSAPGQQVALLELAIPVQHREQAQEVPVHRKFPQEPQQPAEFR
jgi:hypothetical protein